VDPVVSVKAWQVVPFPADAYALIVGAVASQSQNASL
jgi:hypothetical protein